MLNQDYSDILSAFSEEKVEYLLVGAYALATYGYVRTTGDIDLWIKRDEENAKRVYRALRRFGAPLSEISESDFNEPELVFQIGIAPRRIDILTTIDGVQFEEAWGAREEIEVDDFRLPVIGRRHLLINKESTGRPQDLIDADWLRASLDESNVS